MAGDLMLRENLPKRREFSLTSPLGPGTAGVKGAARRRVYGTRQIP